MKTKFYYLTLLLSITMIITACNRNEANALTIETKIENDENLEVATLNFLELEQDTIAKEKAEIPTPIFKKNEIEEYETYINLVKDDSLEFSAPLLAPEGKKYVIQLSCIRDLDRLKEEQTKLQANGYETVISRRINSKGTVYYRLRVKGKFAYDEAKSYGDEIKNKFLNISDYLVLKVK
ncbi:MAG: SPOR domain-containing protein [Candidatus Cloacimonetes bacterium]|nr:SPOR domain-containing protein [Candidatus Cloacimonadota bacterium]